MYRSSMFTRKEWFAEIFKIFDIDLDIDLNIILLDHQNHQLYNIFKHDD